MSNNDTDSPVIKVPDEHLYVDGADDSNNHNNNSNSDFVNIDVVHHKHSKEKLQSSVSQKYSPKCDVSAKEVASAIKRAKTQGCKQEIADVYCQQQEGKLYSLDLTNYCPNRGMAVSGISVDVLFMSSSVVWSEADLDYLHSDPVCYLTLY